MALIVEDGTGLATAESYASVAFADTYHATYGNTAWAALATGDKELLLRKGFKYLEAVYFLSWRGKQFSIEQAGAWPRICVYTASGFYLEDNIVPTKLQIANVELALKANTEDLIPDIDEPGALEKEFIKIGPLSFLEEYAGGKSQTKQYSEVQALLVDLLQGGNTFVRG